MKQSICVQKPTSFCVLDAFATEYLWDILTWMLTAQTTHKYSITGICQSRLITRNYSQTSTNYFLGVKGAKGAERIVITESVRLEVFLIYFIVWWYFFFVFSFIFSVELDWISGKAAPARLLFNAISDEMVSLMEFRKNVLWKNLEMSEPIKLKQIKWNFRC